LTDCLVLLLTMTDSECLYLDYNATTPFAPEVVAAMRPILEGACFGNPSSSHKYGREAHAALEAARAQIASLLGCDTDEIVFTSGGTESNNTALTCCRPDHIIISAVEHPAICAVCNQLAAGPLHTTVHVAPVDNTGLIDLAFVEKTLSEIASSAENASTKPTVLVSVMHANNEVGAVQPIVELAALAHKYGALMHTDAAQSSGKVDVNVRRLGVDLLSLAGHKLYGPKGIGVLYIRRGSDALRGHKFMYGAGHERNIRAGTENVLCAAGLGAACQLAKDRLNEHAQHMYTTRNALLRALIDGGMTPARMRVNGPLSPDSLPPTVDVCTTKILPNTLSVSFRGVSATELLSALSDHVAASPGAACHSGEKSCAASISATLRAMHIDPDWAMGTIRFSVGRDTTVQQVQTAAKYIIAAVNTLAPPS